ncbi:MAG: hypothetical protein ACR2G4_10555 [Pyrinomonadaceae bacterium]
MFVPFSFRAAKAEAENKDAANSLSRAGTREAARVDEPAEPHILAAAYYRVGDDLHTTLMLNNKSPHPVEVQPTLFSLSGERLELAPVWVAEASFSEVDLRGQIGDNPAFQSGSLQVLYHGKDLMVGSQVKIVDAARSLVFDEQLVEPAAMFVSTKLEGVWWLPSPRSEMRLALSNTTDTPLTIAARVDGIAPHQREPFSLTLAPRETRLFELPRDFNNCHGCALLKVGGISLEHTGTPGALLARAFVSQAETGFSSSVQFIDPGKSRSTTLHGAGLRLGRSGGDELSPVIVARNIGDSETVIKARIPYTTGDGQMSALSLPQLRLSAGETKQLPLKRAFRSSHLPRGLRAAGLEFEYTGEPGSVVISAQSVGGSSNQVYRVPLLDPAAIPSGTGGYPWRVEGDSATVVYLKNVTDEPREYKLQLSYPGGVYSLGLRTIAARQTLAWDVRALRDGQAPDAQGRAMPPDASEGQVHWSEQGPETKTMIGRAEQADVAGGASSTYACFNCCPDSFLRDSMLPDSLTGFPGDQSQCDAMQQDQNCYGTPMEPYRVGATWTSDNVGMVMIDGELAS